MPHSRQQSPHGSQGLGPHSLQPPRQTIGGGKHGRHMQRMPARGPKGPPHGPHAGKQQQPLPRSAAETIRVTNQRAIMAKVPEEVRNLDSPWLSAGKVDAIEKIVATGKFCRALGHHSLNGAGDAVIFSVQGSRL